MKTTKAFRRMTRAVAAVATSILTGAGAGVVLARKPLVVPVDRRGR